MPLETKLTAREIVMQAGMSSRPEYYSGRGATLTDLNSEYLSRIHGIIKESHGTDAAKNFVDMVANIKVLSASDFLTCFYFLEIHSWKYRGFQSDLPQGVAVAKDKHGNYDLTSGMFSMMAVMSRGNIDDTEAIRGRFLREQGRQQKKTLVDGGTYMDKY